MLGGTRKYYPKCGNPTTKEHTWFALTDKWILAQKLRIPKIEFTNHRKLKKMGEKVGVLQSFVEGEQNTHRGKYVDRE